MAIEGRIPVLWEGTYQDFYPKTTSNQVQCGNENLTTSLTTLKNTNFLLQRKTISITATTENQKTFTIPIDNFDPNVHKFEVRVGGVPFSDYRFEIVDNTIVLNSDEEGIESGRKVDFVVMYNEKTTEGTSQLSTDNGQSNNIAIRSILENNILLHKILEELTIELPPLELNSSMLSLWIDEISKAYLTSDEEGNTLLEKCPAYYKPTVKQILNK